MIHMPLYLVSYQPFAGRSWGLDLAEPFVDDSIRREPDLQSAFPSITCLCRAGKFAPRLRAGDAVVYLTKKSRYGPESSTHRRLTAILRVKRVFGSHEHAAVWYQVRGLPLPSNCMVLGNPPIPIGKTRRRGAWADARVAEAEQRVWDSEYRGRASAQGTFVACDRIFVDLSWNAPIVHDSDLIKVFGRVPGTLNPGALPEEKLHVLMYLLKIAAPPSSP